MKEVMIEKENAVFWMDGYGRWYNRYGPFEHKKIIDYFNSCIRKDSGGFFLEQQLEGKKEKVYFRYEDTALFVLDIVQEPAKISLVLNTKKRVQLKPKKLFIENENLYMMHGEDRIKFVGSGLMRISKQLIFEGEGYWIRFGRRKYRIPVNSVPAGSADT